MGAYPADFSQLWALPDTQNADDLALEIDDHPCVWTDGSAAVVNLADVTVAMNSNTSHTACTDVHFLSAHHIALNPCTTSVTQGDPH